MKPLSSRSSTALLTAVSLFSQAVGFLYRVGLSRTVGAEVMGLYQLVMPVFSVLLSLTAVGFTAACSHLSARYQATGDRQALRFTVRRCVTGFLAVFVPVALVVGPLSDWISVHLLGDARTRLGLLLLLPLVLLTGVENIHKHYFYGTGRVRPPAFTEICEQLIRTGAVLGLLGAFLPQSPERTVGLIVTGMLLCEVFSALTLTALYHRAVGPAGEVREPPAGRRTLTRNILAIAAPMGATALLGNLMGAWTAVLVPQRLVRAGADVSSAMSAFGVLCGMTLPLVNLPTAVISAMGLVLLPRMAQCAALGQREQCRVRAGNALSRTAALVLPAAGVLAVLAKPLGQAVFKTPGVGQFALPLAAAVALGCFEAVTAVCLNALGMQRVNAAHALLSEAVQLFLTWQQMALPGVGLRGYVEAILVSTALGTALNWRSLRKAIGLRFQWFRWVVAPGLSAALAGLTVNLLFPLLVRAGIREGLACLGCVGFGGVLAFSALVAQGAVDRGWKM